MACQTFTTRAACSPDGFHPRHFLLLPPDLQRCFALAIWFAEQHGRWPGQVDHVMTVLTLKLAGMFRAIHIFSSLYRVWSKLSRHRAGKHPGSTGSPPGLLEQSAAKFCIRLASRTADWLFSIFELPWKSSARWDFAGIGGGRALVDFVV